MFCCSFVVVFIKNLRVYIHIFVIIDKLIIGRFLLLFNRKKSRDLYSHDF